MWSVGVRKRAKVLGCSMGDRGEATWDTLLRARGLLMSVDMAPGRRCSKVATYGMHSPEHSSPLCHPTQIYSLSPQSNQRPIGMLTIDDIGPKYTLGRGARHRAN